ncbi:hypothetical protein STEG23_008775, partial [Scotinomys teguina]
MQRHGATFTQADAVAVSAAAAAATAFAARVSLPLFLCRLREPPYCPGGTEFTGQKTPKLGKHERASGIATPGRRRDGERQGSLGALCQFGNQASKARAAAFTRDPTWKELSLFVPIIGLVFKGTAAGPST